MYDRLGLACFALRPLRLCHSVSDQLSDTGGLQIACLRNSDVANQFALAFQKPVPIGQQCAEIESEIDPVGMRGREHERVAGTLREREVVGDRVYLVDELAGLRSFFENQFARGKRELLNLCVVAREELDVARIGRAQAHPDSVSQTPVRFGLAGVIASSTHDSRAIESEGHCRRGN